MVTTPADHDPESLLHQLDDRYLDCRDLGHTWRRLGFYTQDGRIRRRLSCSVCGTDRTDNWSADGGVRYPSRYDYADGYTIPGGGVTRAAVRHEVIGRVTVYGSEAQMLAALKRPSRRRGA